MRILILGGTGMLGHKLWQRLSEQHEVWITVRTHYNNYATYGLFEPERTLGGVDAFNFDSILHAMAVSKPDAVINCIGITKQIAAANDPIISLNINSLFPHRLSKLCQASAARLIHVSTDCVFSGRRGMYTEEDVSDAEDRYGRTKYLGEINAPGSLTLRISIIGRELSTTRGLLEWFLSQQGKSVRGFSQAIYTGFTTIALSQIMIDILEKYPHLEGLYHVSSDPISKYDLLIKIRDALELNIEVEPDEAFICDRSLDSSRFRVETGYPIPDWDGMIAELARDNTPYDEWRKQYATT